MTKTQQLYRYKPADNKTPGHHKTIGHLVYGDVYDHPDCAGNPDFEEVKETKRPPVVHSTEPTPAENDAPVSEAEPGTAENPIVVSDDTEPPAKPADTAKSGRSK